MSATIHERSASSSGDPPLAHELSIAAGCARLSLEGELDLVAEPQLALLLDRCSSAVLVIVDLRAVTFISCGVVGQLAAASRRTLATGGRFVVVPGRNAAVRRVFDVTGMEPEFEHV